MVVGDGRVAFVTMRWSSLVWAVATIPLISEPEARRAHDFLPVICKTAHSNFQAGDPSLTGSPRTISVNPTSSVVARFQI